MSDLGHEISFDVVLARHVLWALRAPGTVLARWIALLRPRGTLVLIEGPRITTVPGYANAGSV